MYCARFVGKNGLARVVPLMLVVFALFEPGADPSTLDCPCGSFGP